uniref:TNFR-Cys domain-containing protein n=1 Tax=Athene cunicularia TaxID=194338 RepID=A0A663LPN1_ATHCN
MSLREFLCQYKRASCTHTVDTKCSPCRPDTYTAIWNRSPQCFACSPPCRKGFVQNQTCTESQDRICSCPPNEYCISKIYEYCKICKVKLREYDLFIPCSYAFFSVQALS